MNFLEAHAAIKAFTGGPELPLLFAMSGTAEPLLIYIRAAAAKLGWNATPRFLAFNTLQQALHDAPRMGEREVFFLTPWDLVSELDWRTGVAQVAPDESILHERAIQIIQRICGRGAAMLYVPAECPPLWLDPERNNALNTWLSAVTRQYGAALIDPKAFSLRAYLANGMPLASSELGLVAEAAVLLVTPSAGSKGKVLVTDLDETLWAGVVGDDGPSGIAFRSEGRGYVHFLYQTFLRRLRADGVLLAVVSKNDEAIALQPFASDEMVLSRSDFVAFFASWNAKSAQIRALAEQLNLGLDSIVFVDDNPVELAEVASQLPMVHCVQFPKLEQDFPGLLAEIAGRFVRREVTSEDRERTELYQRRLASMVPSTIAAGEVRDFLRELSMSLTIHDRSTGDRVRAVQLINKTNQFNLNGRLLDDAEVAGLLAEGSRLFTASLSDRTGSHGEILAAIVSPQGQLTSMVMSCRVFQRRVEFAFLAYMVQSGVEIREAEYLPTTRNAPTKRFLEACIGELSGQGSILLDSKSIVEKFANDLDLFAVSHEHRLDS